MAILYILIGLILALLLIAALLPREYNIEQTMIIHRPVNEVMDKVADLNYYSKWNPWQMMEPSAKYEISGVPKTPGHRYSWNGKKNGVGSLTLKGIDSKHVHFDLEFLKPWKSKAKDNWLFEHWGQADTKVTWQNRGDLPFPIARLMGPSLSKTLNRQFAEGLKNLQTLCEKKSS